MMPFIFLPFFGIPFQIDLDPMMLAIVDKKENYWSYGFTLVKPITVTNLNAIILFAFGFNIKKASALILVAHRQWIKTWLDPELNSSLFRIDIGC
jgi:hypothetical protein